MRKTLQRTLASALEKVKLILKWIQIMIIKNTKGGRQSCTNRIKKNI